MLPLLDFITVIRSLKMAQIFKKFRPGYELVKTNFEWNVRVPFLLSTNGNGKQIDSPLFSPKETSDSKWILELLDKEAYLLIRLCHCNSSGTKFFTIADPVLVKISILNQKKTKVFKEIASSKLNSKVLKFKVTKQMVIKHCQQENGSYTFACKIISHKK